MAVDRASPPPELYIGLYLRFRIWSSGRRMVKKGEPRRPLKGNMVGRIRLGLLVAKINPQGREEEKKGERRKRAKRGYP